MIHSTKNLHKFYLEHRLIIQLNNYDVIAFQLFKIDVYISINLSVLMFHFMF